MQHDEANACLRVLLAVAQADGTVAPEEETALELLCEEADCPQLRRRAKIVLDEELPKIRSADARRTTFEAAVAIASIDGECSEEEHALLDRIRTELGIEGAATLETAEDGWLAKLREPRKKLAQATIEFLHAVAQAKKAGDLSQPRYEKLVKGLHVQRDEALREVLPARAMKAPRARA